MINKKIYTTLPVFKKSKVKYQIAGVINLTDAQKKVIEDGNKKRLSDAANMEIEYEPGTIPATTRGIIVPSKSSPTTLFTTTPTLGKKVIRLDNGETNDYYEVDVDSNGKPIFNTKVKLDDAKKKDYSKKYYFGEPSTATSTFTVNMSDNLPANNIKVNNANSMAKAKKETYVEKSIPKTPVTKTVVKPTPIDPRKQEIMKFQKSLVNNYGAPENLSIDGIIGDATRKAYDVVKDEPNMKKYLTKYPELNTTPVTPVENTKPVTTTEVKETTVPKEEVGLMYIEHLQKSLNKNNPDRPPLKLTGIMDKATADALMSTQFFKDNVEAHMRLYPDLKKYTYKGRTSEVLKKASGLSDTTYPFRQENYQHAPQFAIKDNRNKYKKVVENNREYIKAYSKSTKKQLGGYYFM